MVPWIIVAVDHLPFGVPQSCSVALRHGVVSGPGGGQSLIDLLAAERCCYGSTDWMAVSDEVVEAVRAVGGSSGAAITDELQRRSKDPQLLRRATEWVNDGMNWSEGMAHVSGGEHRLCALRQQGGQLTVVFSP